MYLYIEKYHGNSIIDQIRPKIAEDLLSRDMMLPVACPIQVILDLDLSHMHLFDPFLGENFTKCFFRYCGKVADIVKEIFIDLFIEEEARLLGMRNH